MVCKRISAVQQLHKRRIPSHSLLYLLLRKAMAFKIERHFT